MKTIKVITSQSQDYYNRIGKDCIATFLQYWPEDVCLELYAEKFNPNINNSRLLINSMDNVLSRWETYLNARSIASGKKMTKFWLKSFVVLDALKNKDCDYLIWLDSDVITHKTISKEFILDLMKDDTFICDIPAGGFLKNKESETGFCIVDMNSKYLKDFIQEYESYYLDEKKIKSLHREIDSAVWWEARKHVISLGAKTNGLASTIKNHVPFMGTILKEFMRHWVTKANKIAFEKNERSTTYEEEGMHVYLNKADNVKKVISIDDKSDGL